MQLPNTKILIIVAGAILIILIAVTIFVSGLTNKNQASQQQPTLIPTGIFESGGSFQNNNNSSSATQDDPFVSELSESTNSDKLMTEDEANKLEDLKNKVTVDTTDFTIGYSSTLGEFFVSIKNSQGEEKFKQYLSDNGLLNVYNNFPGLFHISSRPLDEFIKQTEKTVQNEINVSEQQLQDRITQQQTKQTSSQNKTKSAKQQQIEKDARMLKSFAEFAGSLFTFSTGGSSSLKDIINSSLTPTQAPSGGGGGGGGGTISATARELLQNHRLTLAPNARLDLKNGIVDNRLVNILATILQKHTLYILVFKTGHSMYVAGTNSVSNHYYGRAADIMTVDGNAVNDNNRNAYDIVQWSTTLDCPIRPGEVGSPWAEFDPLNGWFNNAAHENHIHIGYYQGCPNPKP